MPTLVGKAREAFQTVLMLALIGAYIVGSTQMGNLKDDTAAADSKATAARSDAQSASRAANVNAAGVSRVEDILARACAVAPNDELADKGLTRQCSLAQQKRISEVVPVIGKSDGDALRREVDAAVRRYVDAYDPKVPGLTDAALRDRIRAIVVADTTLRGATGPTGPTGATGTAGAGVTEGQVAQAVASLLLLNAPKAVVSASLTAECSLALTYNDGTTDTVGPLCGRDGTNGADGKDGATGPTGATGAAATQADLRDAVAAYCASGTECRPREFVIENPLTGEPEMYTDPDGDGTYERGESRPGGTDPTDAPEPEPTESPSEP